jgi:hypothetical protein
VDESTRVIILLVLILLLMLALAFLGSSMLMRRAIKQVIKMFRNNEALTPETAKELEQIGFKKKHFFQVSGLRDYKPTAMQMLIRYNIILFTEDGRYYLSEDALSMTKMGQQRL